MNTSLETHDIAPFYVVGIAVRTSNDAGKAAQDIPALWGRFFAEGIAERIPNTAGSEVYCVYTDYEGDYTKPYTTVLGCKVETAQQGVPSAPEGMVAIPCGGGTYTKRTAVGSLNKGVVFGAWTEIWNSPLRRVYTSDFEVYGAKAANPENAEVDIFVGIEAA